MKAEVITDRRRISVMCKKYMQGNYVDAMQTQDLKDLVAGCKKWMAERGIVGTFGGADGFQGANGKMNSVLTYFVKYKRLHPAYVVMKRTLKITEKDLAKAYGYKNAGTWLTGTNREKRICELVEAWNVLSQYCEAKRV